MLWEFDLERLKRMTILVTHFDDNRAGRAIREHLPVVQSDTRLAKNYRNHQIWILFAEFASSHIQEVYGHIDGPIDPHLVKERVLQFEQGSNHWII